MMPIMPVTMSVILFHTGACSFEGGLCQWTQDKTEDDFDWQLTAAGTPSSFTGPSTDHTFGNGSGKIPTFWKHG
jgi:hypothetical protein